METSFPTTLNRQSIHGAPNVKTIGFSATLPGKRTPIDLALVDFDKEPRKDVLLNTNRPAMNNLPLLPRPLTIAVSLSPKSNPELRSNKNPLSNSFPTFPMSQPDHVQNNESNLQVSITNGNLPAHSKHGTLDRRFDKAQRFNVFPYDHQYPIFKEVTSPSLTAALKMGSADGHPSKFISEFVNRKYDPDTIAPATGIVDIVERTIENYEDFDPDITPSMNGQSVDFQLPTFYQPPASVLAKKHRSKQVLSTKELQILLFHVCRIGDYHSLVSLLRSPKLDINTVDDEGRTPLIFASAAGHVECVDFLLKKRALVHQADYSGRTSLHFAAIYGKVAVVDALLKAGADPCCNDYTGKNVFHCSSAGPNDAVLKRLIKFISKKKSEADLNILNEFDDDNMTCLMWACFHGNFLQVKRLLKQPEKFVTPSIADVEGKNALHWTIENKNVQCASVLLGRYPNLLRTRDKFGRTALHLSCSEGNISLAYFFLALDSQIVNIEDEMKRTAAHWACLSGRSSILRILCEFGVNLDFQDIYSASPLFYAVQQNQLDCVNILLRYGASVSISDQNSRTALMWASIKGNLELLKLLCETRANNNSQDKSGLTALHFAAYGGHLSCCVYLIRNGANINSKDEKDQTALFHAAISGHSQAVIALIEEGAEIDCQDSSGRRPLAIASSLGHVDVVNVLLSNSALVDARDSKQSTALHEASFSGKSDVLVILLSHGADANVKDENGVTPMHWSAVNGHIGCCRLLLSKGAEINAMVNDTDRDTPLDYAYLNENNECAQFLIDNGAVMASDMKQSSSSNRIHRNIYYIIFCCELVCLLCVHPVFHNVFARHHDGCPLNDHLYDNLVVLCDNLARMAVAHSVVSYLGNRHYYYCCVYKDVIDYPFRFFFGYRSLSDVSHHRMLFEFHLTSFHFP